MGPDTLLKADKVSLSVDRLPEGKMQILSSPWPDGVVILADRVLEVRYRKGQAHLLRRMRIASSSRGAFHLGGSIL
jgi:hypothetical protein